MSRKRNRLNVSGLLTDEAIDNTLKLAMFIGETMRHTPYALQSEAVIATAASARRIFLNQETSTSNSGTSQHLRLQLLEARLSRLDKDKQPQEYQRIQAAIDKLIDEMTQTRED